MKSLLLVTGLILAANLATAETPKDKCFNVGDTVTVRGRAAAMVNGGTYFEVLEEFCVHFPKKTDRFDVRNLTTIGNKVPPGLYVEVTGELRDLYSTGVFGIGITTTKTRDVDAEVKAALAEARRQCEQWQQENAAKLKERTHGGNVVFEPQNTRGEDFTHNCSIWAVDTVLPHDNVIVRRPTP